jgi:hypothetical protein
MDPYVLKTALEAFVPVLGQICTGRITSTDGKTFMDFDTMTCDPATYARLVESESAHGWTAAELQT